MHFQSIRALNAGVEAARAGEADKGFADVVQETGAALKAIEDVVTVNNPMDAIATTAAPSAGHPFRYFFVFD